MADPSPDPNLNLYEGLFLLAQRASAEFSASIDHLKQILAKAEADVIALSKWDERRLAYRVNGQKRGIYLLAHFRAKPSTLKGLERDCNLSELIVRHMVIKADHLGPTELELAAKEANLDLEAQLREGDQQGDASEAAEVNTETPQAEVAEPNKPAHAEV